MKNLLMILGFTYAAGAMAAPPRPYTMKCRGGPVTSMGYEFSDTTVNLSFKKAATAATQGLAAGECSWLDRPISPSEPSVMVLHPVPPRSSFITVIRYGFAPGPTQDVLVISPLVNPADTQLGFLKELLKPDSYWQFKVYNDGIGHFAVTESAPATP